MGNLDIQDSEYSNDEDIVGDETIEDSTEEPEAKIAKVEESDDDVDRRKKIRRLLDLQLERRRLRKEIDFYSDLDEEDHASFEHDDETEDDNL